LHGGGNVLGSRIRSRRQAQRTGLKGQVRPLLSPNLTRWPVVVFEPVKNVTESSQETVLLPASLRRALLREA